MKNYLLPALFVFLFAVSNANNSDELLKKLTIVNAEWQKQNDVDAVLHDATFKSKTFNDWIATHLMLVEKTLRARDVSKLSSSQKQNRFKLLDELNGYWKAGVFPVNDYLPYKNPVFIDRKGTHCAVGYLMMQSGRDDLAQRINSNEKFAYVHEIKTEGVKEWADETGFTIDELAWVQPGYPPTTPCYDLDSGLNGTVNTIVPDSSGQIVYVAGSFTQSVSGVTCNNVAAWMSGFAGWDWIPLSTGLNGTVHTLLLRNNKLYAGGEFTLAGSVVANHVAVYDIVSGQWQSLGSLDSTVQSLIFYNGELYAGGNFTNFLSRWNGSQWVDVAQGFLYGEGVRTLEVWNNQLVVGGNFELATGALRKHVATYDGVYMGNLGFGTLTPVNDFELFDGKLFAACDVINGADTCAIAVFDNTNWQVRLKYIYGLMDYFEGRSVKSLLATGGHLFAGGDFFCGSGMTYGRNLTELFQGTIDTTQLSLMPLTVTDSTVKALAVTYNSLYFGGDFIAGFGDTTNHIAYLDFTPTGIAPEHAAEKSIRVFPNPASEFVLVQSSTNENLDALEMYDVTGRKVFSETNSSSSKTISVAHLPSGIYFLRTRTKNGWGTARVGKE